jgi:hypothetical protein
MVRHTYTTLIKPCVEWGHLPQRGRCHKCGCDTTGILQASRLYPDGRAVVTYWLPDQIEAWIVYNRTCRPGTTLVVNGSIRYDSKSVDAARIAQEIRIHHAGGYLSHVNQISAS